MEDKYGKMPNWYLYDILKYLLGAQVNGEGEGGGSLRLQIDP